jgi:hypothetical protein
VLPSGVTQTTADPQPITFTRGQTFSGINFGNTGSILSKLRTSSTCIVPPLDDQGIVSGGLDLAAVTSLVNVLAGK